jgi:hypothetical protein
MAIYVIGRVKDVTIDDIKDINPAPVQTIANHPLGNPYFRLGKANGQQTPALHFKAGATVEMPNTSDVKESERGGQLKKLIDAGLVSITTAAVGGTDAAKVNIKGTD